MKSLTMCGVTVDVVEHLGEVAGAQLTIAFTEAQYCFMRFNKMLLCLAASSGGYPGADPEVEVCTDLLMVFGFGEMRDETVAVALDANIDAVRAWRDLERKTERAEWNAANERRERSEYERLRKKFEGA